MVGLVLWTALAPAALGQGAGRVEAEARLEPAPIGIGETTELAIEVRWEGFQGPPVDPSFELENLRTIAGPNRSSSTRFTSGPASRSLTLSWTLAPEAVGPARVYGIRVRVWGTTYELPSRSLEVLRETPERPPPPPTLADLARRAVESRTSPPGRPEGWKPKVFLRAEAEPREPWVGQQVVFTVSIFYQADVSNIVARALPELRGFWVHEIPVSRPDTSRPAQIGGETYDRTVLFRRALFPLRPGPLPLEPTEASMIIRRRSWGREEDRPPGEATTRRSNEVTVEARPLPEAPPGFRGAVGRFALEASLEPARVRMGEAASLRLVLAGEGTLQSVGPPELEPVEGLDALPPERESTTRLDGTALYQERVWRFALVARREGTFTVPAFAIPYFDPRAGTYREATAPALELTAVAVAEPGAETPQHSAGETDEGGAAEAPPGLGWGSVSALTLLAALGVGALGAILTAALEGRRKRRRPADPAARELLRTLEAACGDGEARPRRLAAEVEAAWRRYLERRFGLPAGLAAKEWPKALCAEGPSRRRAPASRGLERLAAELRFLRQAPQLSSHQALAEEILACSRALLEELGSARPR